MLVPECVRHDRGELCGRELGEKSRQREMLAIVERGFIVDRVKNMSRPEPEHTCKEQTALSSIPLEAVVDAEIIEEPRRYRQQREVLRLREDVLELSGIGPTQREVV